MHAPGDIMVTKSVHSVSNPRPLGVSTPWKWRLAAERCFASSTTCMRHAACRKPNMSAVPTISSSRTAASPDASVVTTAASVSFSSSPAATLLRLAPRVLRRFDACCIRTLTMPLREKACLRPSAAERGVPRSSSGSAARNLANGRPMISLSTTAVPLGASSSSLSSSSCRRHTQQSGSPGTAENPASGAFMRSMVRLRARASST